MMSPNQRTPNKYPVEMSIKVLTVVGRYKGRIDGLDVVNEAIDDDDASSWKNNWPMRGRTNYPLLFNREGEPKPAFDAVLEAATR
jgi:GH35 family endo-1,4-beta-xylanase